MINLISEVRVKNLQKIIDDKFGGNATNFAREALNLPDDKKPTEVYLYLNKTRKISEKKARAIELNLDLPTGYLDKIEESKDDVALPQNKFKIYQYEAKASMGNGIEVITPDNVVGYEIFDEKFLSDFRVREENLAIITVIGDSMEPTLRGGGRVVIDTSVKDKMDNKVFALTTKNHLWVKRLRMTPDGYKWQSDNSAHREFDKSLNEMPTTVRIIGRVIYSLGRPVD
ncbi:MAG: helix-turn-helix transcriptional regulator [Neisseriales bacterium]|nr:MAG: helix-turn-helix transcriptional regulator [Neisseriales bacterium]